MEDAVDSWTVCIDSISYNPSTCKELSVSPASEEGIGVHRAHQRKRIQKLDLIENGTRWKRVRSPKGRMGGVKLREVLIGLGKNADHQATPWTERAARSIERTSSIV